MEERTAEFGEAIILFAKRIPRDIVSQPIVVQLVKAGTAIGANYCEADDAESKKDFKYKLSIAKKEARETKYWLRMIVTAAPDVQEAAEKLTQEAKELHLIFNAIVHKVGKKD